MYPSPDQIRAARALLNMHQEELAELARVSKRTIANMEAGNKAPIRATLEAVMAALMSKDVRFTYDPQTKRRGVEGPPSETP